MPGGPACLSAALEVFWEGHSAQQQLDFLAQVHGLERVVLIQHAGCAFYRGLLKVPADRLEARQLDDLAKSVALVRRRHAGMVIDTYFARREGARVHFERVSLGAPER